MADAKIAFMITTDDNHEGGFQKQYNDKGNWTGGEIGKGELKGTKYGISAREFPNLDIENLTKDAAIQIYIEGYWKTLYSQINSQEVANKLADLGVLFGVGTAVGILQLTLGVVVDHAFGPNTLAAINQTDETSLLSHYKGNFATHAFNVATANPAERGNLTGWVRRINS